MILNQFKSDNFDVHRDWVYIVENPTLSFNRSISRLYHCRLLSIDEPKVDLRVDYTDAYQEALDAGFSAAAGIGNILGKGFGGPKGMALFNAAKGLLAGTGEVLNANAGLDLALAQRHAYKSTTMSVSVDCGVLDLNGAGMVRESEFWLQHLVAAKTLRDSEYANDEKDGITLSSLSEGYLKSNYVGGMFDDDDRTIGALNADEAVAKAMKSVGDAVSTIWNEGPIQGIIDVANGAANGAMDAVKNTVNAVSKILYRRYCPPIVDIYCRGRVFRGMCCVGINQSEVSKTLQPYIPRWYANYTGETVTDELDDIKITSERTVPISCKWRLSFKPIDKLLMVPTDAEKRHYMLRQCIWGKQAIDWKKAIDDLYNSGVFYMGQPDITWMNGKYSPKSKKERDTLLGTKEQPKQYQPTLNTGAYWDLSYGNA